EEIPSYARTNFETKEGKMKLLDRLVKTELLKQAAIDAGYEKMPEIEAKLEEARERILTSEYFKNEMNNPRLKPESELLDYYNNHKEEFATNPEIDVSHILFDSETKAQEVYSDLKNNTITFDEAVTLYSSDAETKENGGKLGVVKETGVLRGIGSTRDIFELVRDLNKGDLTEPYKSRQGWHIFRVDNKTSGSYQSFDEVKDQISEKLLVTEDDLLKEYNSNKDDYLTRARAKIRHIQLNTESDADAVYQQLQNGADFNDLVKQKSTDTASVRQNGNLGYLYKDGYIRGIGKDPAFEAAVFKLEPGEYSKPIQSQKGWHIVYIDEKTEETVKPFSEVRAQIQNKLIRDAKENAVEQKFQDLMKKYNAKIYEERVNGME
ncbi:peptidyl-prolyl cis-trans isomerase, partial [bacterium]|nr:peptidyl-prolyl cis-trans isomerase [candidate division CSSED10-310 bacterium]